jgi:hypothetical protein
MFLRSTFCTDIAQLMQSRLAVQVLGPHLRASSLVPCDRFSRVVTMSNGKLSTRCFESCLTAVDFQAHPRFLSMLFLRRCSSLPVASLLKVCLSSPSSTTQTRGVDRCVTATSMVSGSVNWFAAEPASFLLSFEWFETSCGLVEPFADLFDISH